MCRHRCDNEGVDIGHEDRPARGERIRSRAGGRRDYQAVGLVSRYEYAIDEDITMIQPRDRALANDNVIESIEAGNGRAAASHFTMDHGTHVKSTGALVDALERRVEFVERNLGQKSQSAEVNSQNRNPR